MQTVPSLVGTGTAIAAAATGLVFGQSTESNASSNRKGSHKRKMSIDAGSPTNYRYTSPSSRPGTSSAAQPSYNDASQAFAHPHIVTSSRPPLSRYQRPQTSQVPPHVAVSRKQSLSNRGDISNQTIGESSRDSISSNGSWMRRLSLRPLSQHGSIRSSIGPDSPSLFSHGSSAPILPRPRSAAPSLPPNKLVKRASSKHANDQASNNTHRRSKSHLPALRRPATSHQRSATLQNLHPDVEATNSMNNPKYSLDHQSRPGASLEPSIMERPQDRRSKPAWTSFFHSKTARMSSSGSVRYTHDASPPARNGTSKRICLDGAKPRIVHLVKPRMVSNSSTLTERSTSSNSRQESTQSMRSTSASRTLQTHALEYAAPSETPQSRQTRRSFSMTFSSAGNWVSRTSGSIRRPKRCDDPHGGDKRHVSAPVTGSRPGTALPHQHKPLTQSSSTPSMHPPRQGPMRFPSAGAELTSARRNFSPPPPPLSSPSSFQGEFPRLGRSGGAATHPRLNQPSGSSTSSTAMSQLRVPPGERSSEMDCSDGDNRGFMSGDDDDTDFKSDVLFDSLRTAASSRVRAVETPLESVYDESPPSTAGNGKAKRLSIQEILGRAWDEDNRIMEEEESAPTPNRAMRRDTPGSPRFSLAPSPIALSPPIRHFGRLSLDDEDSDEDWTRDEDAPMNPLSPPSKGSSASLNSKMINPNIRLALANLDGNRVLDPGHGDNQSERPHSTLFDWSEPSLHEKQESDGRSPRPRTSYAKQDVDARGGRSANRKGPSPAHVRSQSVPVVHDASEAKPTGGKYGTWGIGSKTVSEDWDEDFEFGGSSPGNNEKSNQHLFAVPESIQATQPSVKAHSGQIRELSLLVNDLKRLCRHGRDMNMLDGSKRALWKEAEGIIALASPDEDSGDEVDSHTLINLEAFDVNERLLDEGFDTMSLDKLDAAFDGKEPTMSKTAVVRERHSPKRRSVFSPEDDIFGGNWPLPDENAPSNRPSRPRTPERTPEGRPNRPSDVNGVVRTVMEAVQQRQPAAPAPVIRNRMHFDTNSLKTLVRRAGELRDALSEMVRRADPIAPSPGQTPRKERHLDSSPAFTRVFDDPSSSPSRPVTRRGGNNSIMDDATPDNSPSSAINGRMRMMMVG